MSNKMYLTAAEAKALNLPSVDEQIAQHNALMESLRTLRAAEATAAAGADGPVAR